MFSFPLGVGHSLFGVRDSRFPVLPSDLSLIVSLSARRLGVEHGQGQAHLKTLGRAAVNTGQGQASCIKGDFIGRRQSKQ